MTVDVNELPSLGFIRQLPVWITPRFTMVEGTPVLVLHAVVGEDEFHCDATIDGQIQTTAHVMLLNLAGAIFEREYPGEYGNLIARQVAAVQSNTELSVADQAMLARKAELDSIAYKL